MEVSKLTLITKMEGVWDHLRLGLGLGRESDGMMMRMCDYDRLHYDDWDQPGTATTCFHMSGFHFFLNIHSPSIAPWTSRLKVTAPLC